ncbi:MAG: PTS glucose transporter subunit IIA [Tepidibacter sp.]|jgi:glucose-specific phosphotransferase system IIA component|uniref:PTS sugar transporter subunit IIA n=1 Tax=Tepidibacter sp. TaxID=2529387 RepID=UPI0025D7409D|nr:PTS glucose transporter subunit IIA [Tepidibacter sp.]MCT4509451.1 PTS glucose transporter subunit IIA [Tepidibacter sp.]
MFNFFKNSKEQITIKSPFEGEIVDITKVNDHMFSSKMLGDGVAVIPSNNKAVAPCDGEITQIFPTNHAFGITTKEGLEILVHIGIDTVELKGEGFKRILEAGTWVKKGDAIVEVDLEYIKNNGKDTITPIIITNMDKIESMHKNFKNIENVISITLKK